MEKRNDDDDDYCLRCWALYWMNRSRLSFVSRSRSSKSRSSARLSCRIYACSSSSDVCVRLACAACAVCVACAVCAACTNRWEGAQVVPYCGGEGRRIGAWGGGRAGRRCGPCPPRRTCRTDCSAPRPPLRRAPSTTTHRASSPPSAPPSATCPRCAPTPPPLSVETETNVGYWWVAFGVSRRGQ